ncbi:PREDICTED: FGGY carbohydrate kinase domain-containing protein-like [Priapulus caudatus]|uniref:FGGY carbohydrate kinase domain-containing protein-like n=1 Tax=Priapulus caudatus TaxID=37621 RepID=A0ABM1EMV2_PRICU|nr:PREDICTED: FGGY carbohydrate kinase domain-containing protein-like [Priapulus caudatus]
MDSSTAEASTAEMYIGVDVGTCSVRAGLFTRNGELVSMSSQPLRVNQPKADFSEQSSDEIWEGVCSVVKAVAAHTRDNTQIKGIGFDATCSLVVLDEDFLPVSVSPTGDAEWNVVMWMDHRAKDQAERINAGRHDVLRNVGGKMSLEMQPPKLMWLKECLHEQCWKKAKHFMDLPDFLTFKATGSTSRSLCSLVCKWGFQASEEGERFWDDSFWQEIGLHDLVTDNHDSIGSVALVRGRRVRGGRVRRRAGRASPPRGDARWLRRSSMRTRRGLGAVGCRRGRGATAVRAARCRSVPVICGTSACHMAISERPLFVPGVWGPFYAAMVPNYWLSEAGQSAAGKLLDHIIETHPAYAEVMSLKQSDDHAQVFLNRHLQGLSEARGLASMARLTAQLHVWPDFHGNRSPIADPNIRGMICGLTLDKSVDDLAILYLASMQALAYSTRSIIEALVKHGHDIQMVILCAGLSKNSLYCQVHADALEMSVVVPEASECVLLGAALLASCAAAAFASPREAMQSMTGSSTLVKPTLQDRRFHEKKYKVFTQMVKHQDEYKVTMAG